MRNNVVYFEAQIQNITNSVLFMEHVQLQSLKECNKIEEITKTNHNSNKILNLIKPLEVKQYLFKIIYDNIEKEEKPLVAGKLDISWRNSLGENGRLQTHPLSQIVKLEFLIIIFLSKNKQLNCHILVRNKPLHRLGDF